MEIIKEKTVAFTGDSILSTPDGTSDLNLENVIRTELQLVIEDLCGEGKNCFLINPEPGFGLLTAEVVSEYAKSHPKVKWYAVIPFAGQELCYSETDRLRYKRMYESVTGHIFISENGYDEKAYSGQRDFLIANSSEMVVYHSIANPDMEKMAGDKAWNMYDELEEYFSTRTAAKQFLQDYPDISSFRYGREGVVFEGHNQPFPVNFSQIEKIVQGKEFLCFFLDNGLKIFASLTSDECRITSARNTDSYLQ